VFNFLNYTKLLIVDVRYFIMQRHKKINFKLLGLLIFLWVSTPLYGQQAYEVIPPDYIKSILFRGEEKNDQFPIISLDGSLLLRFDDLDTQVNDYYYKLKHFNADWTPSTLFSNEIFQGFDNIRIQNFVTSFNTLQPYTHYQLQLPNENTRFLVSGNYLLEIYNAADELLFSRKFCVYEKAAAVAVAAYRSQNLAFFETHQSLRFKIMPQNFVFQNPEQNVKVVLLQNYQWDNAIQNVKPQFYAIDGLEYRFDDQTLFEGGNEYFFFDSKDLRITTPDISYVSRSNIYETYLFTDPDLQYSPYSFAQDINGSFEPRTLMGNQNPYIEADYSLVHFSLSTSVSPLDNEIYIYGSFNNYALEEANKMFYNPALELYEGLLLLKQGFYNYKYVVKKEDKLFKNRISGSHAQTENEYQILVYYRENGALYDALIGVGKVSSFNLKN